MRGRLVVSMSRGEEQAAQRAGSPAVQLHPEPVTVQSAQRLRAQAEAQLRQLAKHRVVAEDSGLREQERAALSPTASPASLSALPADH
jgi:hypothetical protein